jgi:hypothetical protein
MPQFIRHHVNPVGHSAWAIPILGGILAGLLLALIANYLKESRWVASAMKAAPVASIAPDPMPATDFRKPVRYEAIIANWRQYRSANPLAE